MTGAQLHHQEGRSNYNLDLGLFRTVTTHCGMDRTHYADIHFQHGKLSMTADDLVALVRRSQEQLSVRRRGFPDCSGSLTNLEDGGL